MIATGRKSEVGNVWFLGPEGSATTALLATELFGRLRAAAEARFGRAFDRYAPWMSNPDRLDAFARLAARPSAALDPVVTDPAILGVFRDAYRTSPEAPLGYLTDADHASLDLRETSETEARRLRDIFLTAKGNIMAASRAFRVRFAALHQTFLPLAVPAPLSKGRAAFSSHEARGAIFLEPPDTTAPFWDIILEIDIAHELGHTALIVYQATDPILASELGEKVYSAIRKTDRPAIMSFHAVAALGFMIEYLEAAIATGMYTGERLAFAHSELVTYRRELAGGLKALEPCAFTPIGQRIHDEIAALLRA